MEDIYTLSDTQIQRRLGSRLRSARLQQNITQQSLANSSQVSLSSIKKIEGGEIGSFESFLRLIRTLGFLDSLQDLVNERQMSPSEIFALQNSTVKHSRKRASGNIKAKKEEAEW